MRKRVEGKSKKNIDMVAEIAKDYGMQRTTVMSYWKDAVKDNPDTPIRTLAAIVRKMIDSDQND